MIPLTDILPGGLRAMAIPAAVLLLVSSPAPGQDWVAFVDESSTRISAAAAVGTADVEEKDIAVGDVDRDGDQDVLIARKEPFSTPGGRRNVLFVNEYGVMTDRTTTLAPDFLDVTDDRDIALVDVDSDGWLDIVTVTTFGEAPRIYINLGAGPGGAWRGFDWDPSEARLPTFSPAPKFCSVGFGDVTGSNGPDLFFVDYDNDLEDRLLINDGNGFFTDETGSRMTLAMSESVFGTDAHIVDMNGDGFRDIVKNSASGSNPPPGATPPAVRILYNDGTGDFDFMDQPYTDAPYMVEVADFTLDGKPDLFVVDDEQDRTLINQGNDGDGHAIFTTTTVGQSPNTAGFGGNVKFADLDADGILDVLVSDVDTDIPGCGRSLVLLRGQGVPPDISYSDPLNGDSRIWLPNGTFDIEALHVDHDGNLDLWAGTCTGNQVFMGTGGGIFFDGFEDPTFGWWSSVVGGI